MSAIISKATGLVNGLITKSTQAVNCGIYWSKVGAELGKQVYKAEGLAPPSGKQFETVYQQALKFIKSPEQQKKFLQQVSEFKPSAQCAAKASIYGIQLAAFFSVGEMIGRRQIVGYPSFGEHHH